MPTIHFVYALPDPDNILEKYIWKLFHVRRRGGTLDSLNWPSPLRAPQSITFQVANFLAGKYRLKLYDLRERSAIHPKKGDILLGHVWPDEKSIMWKAIDDKRFSRKYLIQPYNNDALQVGWLATALDKSDGLFAIGGDYWFDQINDSPLSGFRDKLFHANMAVASADYPLVKHQFNLPGKRRFFYIGRQGRFGDEKGLGLLEQLAEKIPGFEGGYICGGAEIRGWTKIAPPSNLTPDLMKRIAADYDVFLNMSRADAQATTVLEAMCWGFPVACTKQTGYSHEDSLFYLSTTDMEHNLRTIEHIQNLPDDELRSISDINRRLTEEKYSWHTFLMKLEAFMRET